MAPRELEELLATHFDGSGHKSDAAKLDELLAADANARNRFATLARVEGLLRARATTGKTEAQLTSRVVATLRRAGSRRKFVGGVMDDLPAKRSPRWAPRLIAAAALLVAALGGAWLLMPPERAGVVSSAANGSLVGSIVSYGQKLSTAPGESLQIQLADGSRLDLAPGSEAEVTQRRKISLSGGKLSLKCKADRSHPFSVLAHGTEARAVGTEYTVEIEEKDKMKRTIVVSILTGLVLVTNQWGQLEAGESQVVISVKDKAPALLAKKAPDATKPDKKPAPPKAEGALAKLVSAEYTDMKLEEVCKYVSGLGPKVLCDDGLGKTPITLRLSKVPLVGQIRWLARLSKAKAYELPDKTIIITQTKPKNGTELLYEAADDSEEWKKEIERKLKKKINFQFIQAPLTEALNFFQQVSDVNMVIDPALRAKDSPVTLKMTQAELRLAIAWILKLAGAEYELVDHALFMKLAPKKADGKKPAPAAGPSKKLKAQLAKKINLEFDEQPLAECINYCRGLTDINIIVDTKALGASKVDPRTPITLRFTKMPLGKALAIIVGMAGLRLEYRKGDVVYITRATGKKPKVKRKPAAKSKKKAPPEVF